MVYSLLDYPAGVVPNVTSVSQSDRVHDTLAYVHGRNSEDPQFSRHKKGYMKWDPPAHIHGDVEEGGLQYGEGT